MFQNGTVRTLSDVDFRDKLKWIDITTWLNNFNIVLAMNVAVNPRLINGTNLNMEMKNVCDIG